MRGDDNQQEVMFSYVSPREASTSRSSVKTENEKTSKTKFFNKLLVGIDEALSFYEGAGAGPDVAKVKEAVKKEAMRQ